MSEYTFTYTVHCSEPIEEADMILFARYNSLGLKVGDRFRITYGYEIVANTTEEAERIYARLKELDKETSQ